MSKEIPDSDAFREFEIFNSEVVDSEAFLDVEAVACEPFLELETPTESEDFLELDNLDSDVRLELGCFGFSTFELLESDVFLEIVLSVSELFLEVDP